MVRSVPTPARHPGRLGALCCLALLALACDAPSAGDEGVLALSPALTAGQGDAGDRVIIAFRDRAQGRGAVEAAGGELLFELPSIGGAAARVPAAAVAGLSRNPHVSAIEPDVRRYPLLQTRPYGVPMVQGDEVSDSAIRDVMICIIDSGYMAGHPDLPTTVTYSDGPGALVDNCGHGTHVAGTIGAVDNDRGVVGMIGNGALRMHIVKVFGDSCAWTYASELIAAFEACQDNAQGLPLVVNMSLGGYQPSMLEAEAYATAMATGRVLSVAAAGNDGTTANNYPASYDAVMSVAAVDRDGALADFSQRNGQVEISAPGVFVRSTMGHTADVYLPDVELNVGGEATPALTFDGSAGGVGSGSLVDCGLGGPCAGAAGNVCLISRGDTTFAEKVLNCQNSGGTAAIVYNNVAGDINGTLGETITAIPSVAITLEAGQALLGASLGAFTLVAISDTADYTTISGTSMATPHVTAAAALLWSTNTELSGSDVRAALTETAIDLGTPGRDNSYGHGLLQVADAIAHVAPACGSDSDCPDDGDACNGATSCVNGICRTGPPVRCSDGNECTLEWCNPGTGQCEGAVLTGNVCTVDADPCTDDRCDAQGACVATPIPNGGACADDGNPCNGDELCQAGSCVHTGNLGFGVSCADDDWCNGAELCDGAGSCLAGTDACGMNQMCDSANRICTNAAACLPEGARCSPATAEACCSGSCFAGPGGRGPTCAP